METSEKYIRIWVYQHLSPTPKTWKTLGGNVSGENTMFLKFALKTSTLKRTYKKISIG